MSRERQRRTRLTLALPSLALIAGAVFLFRPVCVPIDAETLVGIIPPIEERRETTFYGLPIFRQKNGQWFQCKTCIARQFFF